VRGRVPNGRVLEVPASLADIGRVPRCHVVVKTQVPECQAESHPRVVDQDGSRSFRIVQGV